MIQVIVGQQNVIRRTASSHLRPRPLLMQGVPGLGKRCSSARSTQGDGSVPSSDPVHAGLNAKRTSRHGHRREDPDSGRRKFEFQRGPIFANMHAADEINATPPKRSRALAAGRARERHNHRRATARSILPTPFFVAATQNPVEKEGTLPACRGQLDRFRFMTVVQLTGPRGEARSPKRTTGSGRRTVTKISTPGKSSRLQETLGESRGGSRVPLRASISSARRARKRARR